MNRQKDNSRRLDIGEVYGATRPRFGEIRIRGRGRLPHWERDAGLYFVTYRLADSLPRGAVEKIKERQRLLKAAQELGLKLSPQQKVLAEEYSPKKIEEYLDKGRGACYLRNPRVADLVAKSLHFWAGKRYHLISWCVMPNHVHAVMRLLPGEDLADLLGSIKGYTARKANPILRRSGTLWQREYYDRLLRNASELSRAIRYIRNNPIKAGLENWPWVWTDSGANNIK